MWVAEWNEGLNGKMRNFLLASSTLFVLSDFFSLPEARLSNQDLSLSDC